MKKVIKPSSKEEAVFYSDFSGKCFGEWYPEVTVKINCDYGSKYDGSSLELHLTDKELEGFFDLIKSKCSKEFREHIREELKRRSAHYENSVQSRDWTDCNFTGNAIDFLEKLLDTK